MCLKLSFCHPKWVLEAILSLTVFQTVFQTVQTLTLLFFLTVPNFVVFFRLLNRKFNEDSKNVFKTVILSLQVGFTSIFVPDCPFKLFFGISNCDTAFLSDCTKMRLKQSFSYSDYSLKPRDVCH